LGDDVAEEKATSKYVSMGQSATTTTKVITPNQFGTTPQGIGANQY